MAQTPATTYQDGDRLDYTPGSAVASGAIVLVGNLPLHADLDIAANALGALSAEGVKRVPKVTGALAAGDPVYWNPTASPVSGDASSGAATATAAGGYLMGWAVAAAASGDAYALVKLLPFPATAVTRTPVNADVAAAGSVQGDAAQLYEGFTCVTASDGTKGVILPTAAPGMRVTVKNTVAAILKVYPKTGAAINAIAANGAISLAASVPAIFVAKSATQWYTIPLLPS